MREGTTYQGLSSFRRGRILQALEFEQSPEEKILAAAQAFHSADRAHDQARISGNADMARVVADLLEIKRAKLRGLMDMYLVC